MSQAAVERIIGRLLTDEAAREHFRRAPDAAVAEIADRTALSLTAAERAALAATPADTWDTLAEGIDPRLQRLTDSAPGRSPSHLLGVLLLALLPAVSQAQPPAPATLTLAEARARALSQLPDLAVERTSVDLAVAATDRAAAAWDPVVQVDARARSHTDALNTLFSGAPDEALGPRTSGVSATASWRRLFTNGAAVTAHAASAVDRTNSVLALLTPAYQGSVGVDFRQPLARGRRTDGARQQLRLSRLDVSHRRLGAEQAVIETVASVERAYWTLVAARTSLTIRERSLALAASQRGDVEVRIAAGVAAEADLATSDAAIAERRTAVIAAQAQATEAEVVLKSLMAADGADPTWSMPVVPAETIPLPSIDAAEPTAALVSDALARRPDIEAYDVLDERAALEESFAVDALRPQVDLVGGYTIRGLAGRQNADARLPFAQVPIVVADDLQGAWGQSLRNALGHRFADASIGVQVTVPIGNRAAVAERTAATLRRERLQAQRRATEVRIARDVYQAAAALDAAQARRTATAEARDAATRQLEAEEYRDEGGLSTDFLLLTRQSDLTRAELAEVAAAADEARAAADLDRATGRLLERRGIQWENQR